MQNALIIGDIHGCYDELQAILDKTGLGDGDAIIGIGDVVDRGPETPQVLAFFQNTPNAKAVLGNHERKHVRAARHEVKLSLSQQISKIQLGSAYPAALDWMSTLPLSIELPAALLVHGYFEPGIALEFQNPMILCGTMGGQKILRERYNRPWYELYDGNKPIIVGHENYTNSDQPFIYRDKIFGLDTNCVTGKALTGILLPSFRVVSVPSRGNLWNQVRRSFQPAKAQPPAHRTPVVFWPEEHNQKGQVLIDKLKWMNIRLMAQIEAIPGYTDMSPRQQAKLYSEWVGQGALANLLHLTRQGKLDIGLLRKIVHNPEQLNLLFVMTTEF